MLTLIMCWIQDFIYITKKIAKFLMALHIFRGFTDGYKINCYFNLFHRWSVKNPSVNFKFRTKIFNDPPYFSWSVGNSVGDLTRSEMHLMHNPLEFARSVGNFVGKIDPPPNCRRTYIRRYGRRWVWHFK